MDTPTDQVPEAPGASELIELIRESVIGDDEATEGPFGPRRVTYADYTASGRSLSFIEDYLRAAVLPRYYLNGQPVLPSYPRGWPPGFRSRV